MNLPKLELTRDEVGPIAVIPRIPPQISSQPGQGAKSRHEKVGADRGQGVDKKTNILRQLGIRNYLEAVGYDLPDRYRENLFCPFPDHPGKRGEGNTDSPAFSIFQSDQDGRDLYQCHNPACQGNRAGDVIALHRALTGSDFPAALEQLLPLIESTRKVQLPFSTPPPSSHQDPHPGYYHDPEAYADFRLLCSDSLRNGDAHARSAERYAAGRLCLNPNEKLWIANYRQYFYFSPNAATLQLWIDRNPKRRQPFSQFKTHGLGIVWRAATGEGRAIQCRDITGKQEKKVIWMRGTRGTGNLLFLLTSKLDTSGTDIHITEGSWDTLALSRWRTLKEQAAQKAGRPFGSWDVVGIPSAGAAAAVALILENATTVAVHPDRDPAGNGVLETLTEKLTPKGIQVLPYELPDPQAKDFAECLPGLLKTL